MLSSAWEFIPQQKKWELRKLETKNMQFSFHQRMCLVKRKSHLRSVKKILNDVVLGDNPPLKVRENRIYGPYFLKRFEQCFGR